MTSSIPTSEFVIDIMGLVLRIERRKLGQTAKSILDSVESGNAIVYVPSLVFAEILYLYHVSRFTFHA